MVEILDTIMIWLIGFWTLAAMFAVIKVAVIGFFAYIITACIVKWGG